MQLPQYQGFDTNNFQLMQNRWAAILNPVVNNPLNGVQIITATLKTGDNVINHLLSVKMQGWYILDVDAPTTIYRSAPLNNKTITLHSSAAANVSIGVF